MKLRIRMGIFRALLLVFIFSFSEPLSAQQRKKDSLDFSYLDRKIGGWIDTGFYKGAGMVVGNKEKVLYEKYYGTYRPQTVAYIASAGKWLAAATIAAVVDEGKLAWTDPVNKWIPEMKGYMGKATLKQLLSHTAGYPDYQPEDRDPDNYQTLKESVDHIVTLRADTVPGTLFKYGGLGMQVAGRMTELAMGKDWEAIFQEKLAIPLKMINTHFTPVDKTPGHSPMLGGGARSSLTDYSNFLSMILSDGIFLGKRILSEKSILEMQTDQVHNAKVGPGEFVALTTMENRSDVYGLGEWRVEVDKAGVPSLLSSPSWAGAYPWIDKKNMIYGFFLARVDQIKNGFKPFLSSPVIPYIVRDVLEASKTDSNQRGYVKMRDGAKLYYDESGKGETIIFLHGHSFDRTMWDPQIAYFSKKYRVVRYDIRGYGWSAMPRENQKALHADDLADLMDNLHIQKAHIVGLSLGGFIVSDFIALYPGRILSAVAASGDFFSVKGPSQPWTTAEWELQDEKIKAWKENGVMIMKKQWFDALTNSKVNISSQVKKPIWTMIYKWDAWQPQHHEPRFLLGDDLAKKLERSEIAFPVMSLRGEFDLDKNHKLKKAIPGALEAVVPEAGHVSNLENINGFNSILDKFLKEVHLK